MNELENGIAISTNDDVDFAELNGAWNKGGIVGSNGFGPNTCSRFRVPETNLRFRQECQSRLGMIDGEGEQVLRISIILKSDDKTNSFFNCKNIVLRYSVKGRSSWTID